MPKSPFARLVPHIGRLGRGTRWRRTKGRPRVFAHRGDCTNAPENTLLAFERAVKVGADGIELDVRFDGDKNVVVFHDSALERLVGRSGTMETLPATERAKLRVGGEPVPLFEEVLATFDIEYDVGLKTKPGRGGELVAAVAKIIQSSGRASQCLVSSFDPFALLQFHRQNPDLALGYLFHDEQPLPLRRGWVGQWIGASMVHPQHTLCTEDTVRAWHAAGFPINVWTVDDAAELKRLALLGVDSICSNDPGHSLRVLGELV